jgi:hypothetical protein
VREREITVRYDLRVIDTRTGVELGAHTESAEAMARAVYSDYSAEGDCGEYFLVPPDMKRADPDRARAIEDEWGERFGKWTLPEFLERARRDRGRTHYQPGNRHEFMGDMRERPVFMGDLPDENEMAFIALDGMWQPVLGMLKELDAK